MVLDQKVECLLVFSVGQLESRGFRDEEDAAHDDEASKGLIVQLLENSTLFVSDEVEYGNELTCMIKGILQE